MTTEQMTSDLIDLLEEKHQVFRHKLSKVWTENDGSFMTLSSSEWFIIARTYAYGNPTLAQLTRQTAITRQAVHKAVKSLETKRLIETTNAHNNKEKGLILTKTGEEYYLRSKALKTELEKKIADKIGEQNLAFLKDLLKSDWEFD